MKGMAMREEKAVSGKKVVIYTILGTILFTIVMGYGTYWLAQWLTPILQKRNEAKSAAAPSHPSPPNSN